MLLEELTLKNTQLQHIISSAKKDMQLKAKGHLRTSTSHHSFTYYHIREGDKKRHYIKAKDIRLARNLAQKEYAEKVLPLAETQNGELVRSKSELIIANKLHELNIPYKYEYPVYGNNGRIIFRPDFLALNIKRRKEIYIEHFGMLADENYRDSFFQKINTYSKYGLYQLDNLIMLFEDNDHPLNVADYDTMLKHALLE